MRFPTPLLALALIAAAAGCASPGAAGPLSIHVVNERPTPVDVTVEIDGVVVYEVDMPARDTSGDIRASDPIEVDGRTVHVVVRLNGTGEAEDATLDLREGRHLVVAIGPSGIRLSLHEQKPAFA